jgi:flagellar basal body-associated protein FliL
MAENEWDELEAQMPSDDSPTGGLNPEREDLPSDLDIEERNLPKKVELDIDDLILEDEDVEIPEEKPEAAPEEPKDEVVEEEEEPEEVKSKFSKLKLSLIASAVVIPLAAVTLWLILGKGEKPEIKPEPQAVLEKLELLPFIVNLPRQQSELIFKFKMSLSFPTILAKDEFAGQTAAMRDLIYRYLQGREPDLLEDPEAKTLLAEELAGLLNESLKKGRIESLQILELSLI